MEANFLGISLLPVPHLISTSDFRANSPRYRIHAKLVPDVETSHRFAVLKCFHFMIGCRSGQVFDDSSTPKSTLCDWLHAWTLRKRSFVSDFSQLTVRFDPSFATIWSDSCSNSRREYDWTKRTLDQEKRFGMERYRSRP
jgi:hypothetical protein